jgi:basic amino acid/polyamine antiporter, APA family
MPNSPPLERVIGISGLTFSSFNCIVGSGIFAIPALAAAIMGPAAILGYLVCAVLIGLVGLCFAEVGSRVSSAGGLYAYARISLGPVVGGIAGTLLWLANSAVSSAALVNFLADTLAGFWPPLGKTLLRLVFIAALYAALATVNIRGTRSGARLTLGFGLVKLGALVLLIGAGVFAIHGPNLRWGALPPLTAVGQGAVLLFFVFMGIETGLGMSGEVVNPPRTVPRAIFLALGLVAALYVGLQLVSQGVLGAALPHSTAALVDTATIVFGPWGTRLFVLVTILSIVGYLAADMLCSPRTLYAPAEQGQLPRALARVHPRFGTPAIAIGSYTLLCFLAAASGSFRQLALVASSGTLMLYLICCLGLFRLRARNVAMAGKPFRAPAGPFVPLAACAIIVWMLASLTLPELWAALSIVLVSGIGYSVQWLLGRARRRPPLAASLDPLRNPANE